MPQYAQQKLLNGARPRRVEKRPPQWVRPTRYRESGPNLRPYRQHGACANRISNLALCASTGNPRPHARAKPAGASGHRVKLTESP
jgi:hypothetical protein